MEKDISIFSTILIIVTIVILGGLTAFILLKNEKDVATTNITTYDENPFIDGQPIMGDDKAPITLVEFGDYKCPTCKKWGETILPKLSKDFIDSGKAKFLYVNFPINGKESTLSAIAAESVYKNSPKQYWIFHEALFNAQSKDLTTEQILKISSKIDGIKGKVLEQDIIHQKTASEIDKDMELVSKFDVQETPTIIINNIKIKDPFDYVLIKKIIEKELKDIDEYE